MDELFFIVSKLAWSVLSPSALFVWLTLLALVLLYRGYLQAAKTLLLIMTFIGFTIMAYPLGDVLLEKASNILISEYRSGILGPITLETPEQVTLEQEEVIKTRAAKKLKDEARKSGFKRKRKR